MKSVLISIQPKWCELIALGKKTVEVRKTRPKIDTPFKCYIYETKGRLQRLFQNCYDYKGKGKVIGEFVCDKIICLDEGDLLFGLDEISDSQIEEYSCLSLDELFSYKENKEFIYSWHISDLVIYDKPKELSEFKKECKLECDMRSLDNPPCDKCEYLVKSFGCGRIITRPPQSWCYVDHQTEKG